MAGTLKDFFRRVLGRKGSPQAEATPPTEAPPAPAGPAATGEVPGKPSGNGGGEQAPPGETPQG
jgi:hypothetical protein